MKMSKKKIKSKNVAATRSENTSVKKKDNKMLIFICIFMSAVLFAGAIFGTVFAVRNANAVIEYNGVRMTRGVANYFASYAKAIYLNSQLADVEGAEDTPEFWNTPQMGTKTYGEGMTEYVREYLVAVVAGAYLYDSAARLNSEAKNTIKTAAQNRLLYIADGNKKEFNKLVEPFGFDYDDFYDATEMMYKATMAPYVMYGADAAALKDNFSAVNEFYNSSYRRVRLLFIRTVEDFKLDDDGNRRTDEEGNDKLFLLSDAEISDREEDIALIKQAIANIESGEGAQMSEDSFDSWLEKYRATNMHLASSGEYYYSESDYTARAFEEFPDVVIKALGMPKNSFSYVDIENFGVCFIYRTELVSGAYTNTDKDGPFSDFYSNLSSYSYKKELESRVGEVNVRDKFEKLNLITLPTNGMYTIGI